MEPERSPKGHQYFLEDNMSGNGPIYFHKNPTGVPRLNIIHVRGISVGNSCTSRFLILYETNKAFDGAGKVPQGSPILPRGQHEWKWANLFP